jgi:hypothetical protein
MGETYIVVGVGGGDSEIRALYTLTGTHYGVLLLVFRSFDGEVRRFQAYVQQTLKPGYHANTILIVAKGIEEALAALQERGLVPSGPRVAVEETPFFDEVIAELLADTIRNDE